MDNKPEITTKMIFKEFWRGIYPDRQLFFVCLFAIFFAFTLNIFVPLLYKNFFDILSVDAGQKIETVQLVNLILIIAGIHFISWLFLRISIHLVNKIQAKAVAILKQNAFGYMIRHSRDFFNNNFTGSLVQRVNRFSRSIDRIVDLVLYNAIPLAISIIGSVFITAFTAPVISLIILAWVIIFAGFNILFYSWSSKYNLMSAAADSKTTGLLSDNIINYISIKLFNGFGRETKNFKIATHEQAEKNAAAWNLEGLMNTIQTFCIYLVEFAVFYYAITYWKNGQITIGSFVLIQAYIIEVAQRLWGVIHITRGVNESISDSKEMVEIMALPHDIKNVATAKELKNVQGKIEFKDVNFSFHETRSVLKDINLTIKAGEKVALVGPSGTGKTTFTGLLLRLFDPLSGAVFIDGQNIHCATLESLRQNISLVPQDPVLFHRTILENIGYGKFGASEEEIIAAAKLAHCDEFVEQMPLEYNTLVGERGVKLSGGERQRVAIARAILKRAPILILDEATSSLDSRSEAMIQDALDILMKNCTTIAIAHRLSTIRKMDRIIVMNNGTIVEQGTHQGLIRKKKSIYKTLWTLQAGGFIK